MHVHSTDAFNKNASKGTCVRELWLTSVGLSLLSNTIDSVYCIARLFLFRLVTSLSLVNVASIKNSMMYDDDGCC